MKWTTIRKLKQCDIADFTDAQINNINRKKCNNNCWREGPYCKDCRILDWVKQMIVYFCSELSDMQTEQELYDRRY
jgi:hypothetical protein